MQNRENALNKWLEQLLGFSEFSVTPLTGDASFRQYYRVRYSGINRIVMDAPPEKEPLKPFIECSTFFRAHGIRTPEVFAADTSQGFALLEDFGNQLLLQAITNESAERLYQLAIRALISLQACPISPAFPHFDTPFMLKELDLFSTWFLTSYLEMPLDGTDHQLIQHTFKILCDEISQQPTVIIHRDYHSRNLMLAEMSDDSRLAVIDFQDAMQGPFTYDLVSLLKDCYIQWPRDTIMSWLMFFYEHSSIAQDYSLPSLIRAFDFCGIQRHLKVLGVFARLHLRDQKSNYLKDLPLTLNYLLDTLQIYEELRPFYQFMQRIELP